MNGIVLIIVLFVIGQRHQSSLFTVKTCLNIIFLLTISISYRFWSIKNIVPKLCRYKKDNCNTTLTIKIICERSVFFSSSFDNINLYIMLAAITKLLIAWFYSKTFVFSQPFNWLFSLKWLAMVEKYRRYYAKDIVLYRVTCLPTTPQFVCSILGIYEMNINYHSSQLVNFYLNKFS